MSSIDDLYALIVEVKGKIDAARAIKDALEKDLDINLSQNEELKNCILASIEAYIEQKASSLSVNKTEKSTKEPLPKEEVSTPQPKKEDERSKAAPEPPQFTREQKYAFAMEHRELGGKKVIVTSGEQEGVTAEVVALSIPFVVTRTEDGTILNLRPEQLEVI